MKHILSVMYYKSTMFTTTTRVTANVNFFYSNNLFLIHGGYANDATFCQQNTVMIDSVAVSRSQSNDGRSAAIGR